MAGDWIKFEVGTHDKPEVWAIASGLQIDPDAVVGKLLRIWGWFDQHTESGNAPTVTKMLLDRLVGVSGFCDELVKAGWMSEDGQSVSLPNFDRHNGKTAKNRAVTAKRVAAHKAKQLESNDAGNAEVTQQPLPKEEKNREENKKPKTKTKLSPRDLVDRFGISQQMADQFAQIRKDKKLTMTPIAMDALEREFTKAGMTNQQGIAMCCENSWGGYKASWGRENNTGNQSNGGGRPSHKPFEL